MTNSKNTKRALLASVLSVLLCVAMLIGSTFAWFTDSVTSGKNKIVAGNLDVELYTKDVNGEYTTVVGEDTNLLMDGALWEPGHVEVINLKVANLGTLALKYKFGVNIASEKGSTNVFGEEFNLSDFIKFAMINEEKTYANTAAGREQAIKDAETAGSALISAMNIEQDGVLYPTTKVDKDHPAEQFVTLVVYMPTTVDNHANYKTAEGVEAPEIELGIDLVATQVPYESDSFGTDYDENAGNSNEDSGESNFIFNLSSTNPADGEIQFLTETVETDDGSLFKASVSNLQPSNRKYDGCSFVFPINGTTDKDMKLVFDFKDFKDVYAKAGIYRDYNGKNFQLVGDYWPVTVNVACTKGNAIDFTFTGTLTELVKELSENPLILKSGTVYDEEFTVTLSWPFETAATDTCYVLNNKGTKEDLMDLADTVITDWDGDSALVGNELGAEFAVKLQQAD